MRVLNVHERDLKTSLETAGALIDRLASDDDILWPFDRWPPMRFDRPLGVGAVGGHGLIRYVVEAFEPGLSIRFRFTRPEGFRGSHRFEIDAPSADRVKLRHVIEMQTVGSALLQWYLAIRPLHDALLEDALDRAELCVGGSPRDRRWSLWVRFLRWAMKRAGTARIKSRRVA